MANQIILKKSSVASKVPLSTDLDYGELAINYSDGRLYYKKSDNSVGSFISSSGTVISVDDKVGNITGNDLLSAITQVDGSGSGLDADTLDGVHLSSILQENATIMNTNPFGGRRIYINSVDNAMHAAAKKWYVSATLHPKVYLSETYPKLNPEYVSSYVVTGSGNSFSVQGAPSTIVVYNNDTLCAATATPTSQYTYRYESGNLVFGAAVTGTIYAYPASSVQQYLDSPVYQDLSASADYIFDSNFENSITVPVGYYLKVRIIPNSNMGIGFSSLFYPYGSYFLSYYYTSTPEKAECRTYNLNYRPHGIGWKLASFSDFAGSSGGGGHIQSLYDMGNYGRSIIEFIVHAHPSHITQLTDIDWKLDRPSLSTSGATVSKFGANKLYFDLVFGTQAANTVSISPSGTIQAISLNASSTLSHAGLLPSDGTNVDQIKTITKTITLSTDWQDVGISGTDLATGTYLLQLYANDSAAGGYNSNEYYSGTLSWYSGTTYTSVELPSDEVPLHRAGASSDAGLYLRTYRTNNGALKLQIYSNYANASSSNYVFKFRRLI